MHLAADGPVDRFMTAIGVVFRNVTMHFGIHRLDQALFHRLNTQLAPFGAKASYNGWQIRLELCPGQVVVISQHHTDHKLRPSLVRDDGSAFFYLNVQITVPHCDDVYDGALGQTYKCAQVAFVRASEASFRVRALDSVDTASFSAEAPCLVPPPNKQTSVGVSSSLAAPYSDK